MDEEVTNATEYPEDTLRRISRESIAKDAEITRLTAALARVRGQRDEALLDLDSALNGRVLVSRVSEYIEREHRVRIVGEGKTRTVEEIES